MTYIKGKLTNLTIVENKNGKFLTKTVSKRFDLEHLIVMDVDQLKRHYNFPFDFVGLSYDIYGEFKFTENEKVKIGKNIHMIQINAVIGSIDNVELNT